MFISFVYQFSGIFASGITPMIATYLLSLTNGFSTMLVAYVVFAGVVSALSAKWIASLKGESKQKNVDGADLKVTQM